MAEPEKIAFDDLFASIGVLGHVFSDRLAALDGARVGMQGYLAPASQGGSGLLVLTRAPVAPCSDCGGGHDFPDDAVFVFPAEINRQDIAPGREVEVEGLLEHGSLRLPEAEATSLVRLRNARWKQI